MFFKVITTIAVTAAVFLLAAQTPDAREESDGIAIPLTKRFDTDAREFHTTPHNAEIIHGPSDMDGSERNMGTPHPFAVQRDGSGAGLDLTKDVDGIWYGTIWIGTPPRSFTVQLSTGSSDLLVPAFNGDQYCRSHRNLWNPALSEISNWDLNMDFTIRFTDGRIVSGKQYEDNVTIAGFTADIQTVGAATTYSPAMEVSRFVPDGILGLGFPAVSQLSGHSPLLHTLLKEGKLPQPVFSLKLTKPGGELYVGGLNGALYIQNTLVYTPVTNPFLWRLKIDDIRVNGQIVLRDVPAIIDTGANFVYGDQLGVLSVHKAAGGGQYENFKDYSLQYGVTGFYFFPCRSFPSVTFTISGRPFFIPAHILNKGQIIKNSPNCFSAIAVTNVRHNYWTLGTSFLEQFYTVFDFNNQSPRVGFAELAV